MDWPFRNVKEMTNTELAAELEQVGLEFERFRASIDEGMSGSPGEWMAERMNEIETEQGLRHMSVDRNPPNTGP